MKLLTRDDILMGRDKAYPIDEIQSANVDRLLSALHQLQLALETDLVVSSGYRPEAINAAVKGAAKRSNHIACLAVDLHDPDGALDTWCLENQKALELCGLWLEHPDSTPNWCHLQCVPPKSGRRVFRP